MTTDQHDTTRVLAGLLRARMAASVRAEVGRIFTAHAEEIGRLQLRDDADRIDAIAGELSTWMAARFKNMIDAEIDQK